MALQFTTQIAGYAAPNLSRFYRQFKSAGQRLRNGNTLITESDSGRLFEVTSHGEIDWEDINLNNLAERPEIFCSDIFCGYRYPNDWVPQLDQPREGAVVPPVKGDVTILTVGD